MNKIKSNRKLAAIMFADIVSYSRLMGINEQRTLKLLNDFDDMCLPIVDKYNGMIIKKNGDQIFCEFSSAKNAVDASIEIQENLYHYNDSRPKDFKLEARIGIHIGDVAVKDDGDIFGDGVNVAARIQPLASPGGVCVSGSVNDVLSSHPEYIIASKGEQELKNIIKKHSVFEIKTGFETSPSPKKNRNSISKKSKKLKYAICLFILILALVIIYKTSLIDFPENTNKYNAACEECNLNVLIADFHKMPDPFAQYKGHHETYHWINFPDDAIGIAISDSSKNIIYDELISSVSKMSGLIDFNLKTIYDLKEIYNKKGMILEPYNFDIMYENKKILENMKEANFNTVKELLDFAVTKSPNQGPNLGSYVYGAFKKGDCLGFFPAICKIKSEDENYNNKFFIFSTLFGLKLSDSGDILNNHIIFQEISSLATEENIVQKIKDDLFRGINSIANPDDGSMIITSLNQNKAVFKFSPHMKSKINKHQILFAVRSAEFHVDNVDIALSARLDDLKDYKNRIDDNPESIYYYNFYNSSAHWYYTIEEYNRAINNNHAYNIKARTAKSKGLETVGLQIPLAIKLKVIDVFDSTATAIILEKKNPYLNLKLGDKLTYDFPF